MTKKKKSKSDSHIHKYKRLNLARNYGKGEHKTKPFIVMACQQPGCPAYYRIELMMGKLAECWICGDPFVIDKVSISHVKPHCSNCIKRKVKPEVADLSDLVKDI